MENNKLTLGSLFDGSGGFPLGGLISGITPVWASEIEPFPIRVTTKRLPQVKHYGDISKISGADIEPVDIITFGSPCQDMSVAGSRDGLSGSRSSLFYEAIRIIKEMRNKTNGKKPRYIVWENVPGAFSSNKGEDFRTVLEEICKIKDGSVSIPKSSKWNKAGQIMGDDFSLARRVLDAQFWGVPQRRRRIYLVADFTGRSAGKILFESEGLSGYSKQSFKAWQKATNCTSKSTKTTISNGVMFENHGQDIRYKGPTLVAQTVLSTYGTGGNNQPFVIEDMKCFDVRFTSVGTKNVRHNCYETTTSRTIDTGGNTPDSNQGGVAIVCEPNLKETNSNASKEEQNDENHQIFSASKASYFTRALDNLANPLVATDGIDPPIVNDEVEEKYIVRRLTPTECARLQGFPDWWCDDLEIKEPTGEDVKQWREIFEAHKKALGKSTKPKTDNQIIKWLKSPHSDSAEYKMWGNGVALPNVVFVLSGIAYYSRFSLSKETEST